MVSILCGIAWGALCGYLGRIYKIGYAVVMATAFAGAVFIVQVLQHLGIN